MKVIFGSANHWTSPYQVGSHAWARLFAGHAFKVAYVSDPVTPWHWLDRGNWSRTRERFALWRSEGVEAEQGRLRAWTPFTWISPRNSPGLRSEWVLGHWASSSFPSVENRMREWGFEAPDVLWLDSVRHSFWGRKLHPKATVLRVADWNAGLEAVPRSVLRLEQKLASECDLVITAAESLEKRLRPLRNGKPMVTIRNGVDTAFWMQSCEVPKEYQEIAAPRVVYVGALDRWFDVPLLIEMARALPGVSFVMIGQRRFSLPDSGSPPNVHWLGARSRDRVRGFMNHAQAGIIPFRRTELVDCVCPLKLYEYMACGLPVVATRWEELQGMNSPAKLATGADEWIAHLKLLLLRTPPAEEEKKKLLAYAQANDWQERWQRWESAQRTLAGG